MLTPGTVSDADGVQRPGSVERERSADGRQLLHRRRRQRQFERHRLLPDDADRRRIAAALSASGGTNSLVSVDAMQEFRIQTSSFAPEFRQTRADRFRL